MMSRQRNVIFRYLEQLFKWSMTGSEGFKPMCPPLVQREVLYFFHLISLDHSVAKILYDIEGSIKLVVEVLRQGN